MIPSWIHSNLLIDPTLGVHGKRRIADNKPSVSAPGSLCLRPQIPSNVKAHLDASGVVVVDYARLVPDVCALAASGNTLWLDPGKVSYAIFQAASNARDEAEKGEGICDGRVCT